MLSLSVHGASCIILTIFVFYAFSSSTTSQHRCLVCNISLSGCEDAPLAHSKDCPLQADKCFTAVQNGMLLRGCLSQLSSAAAKQCSEADGASCLNCTEADCNRNQWLKCDQCDDDGSVRCSDKRKAQAQLCPQFKSGDRCYEMRRSSNRHTVLQRGCQSSLEAVGIECSEETQCRDYTEHDINVVDSRQASYQGRKCLICSTDAVNGKQCDEASAGLEAKSCDLAEDECITMVQDNVLHRKCKSALTTEQQQLCTDMGEDVCVSCKEDGCNRHTLLKCIQCKKSIDPLCRDPSLSNELAPKYCSRFHPGAQCFSRILNEDVERGCTSDSGLTESVCEDNKYCLACATNGCNKETEDFLRDVARCLRCSSSKGDDINCEEATGNTEENRLNATVWQHYQQRNNGNVSIPKITPV
ncbi:uncharacterized protein LOC125953463 [Anopheles darlingi]|uniref:uncharacterized protein LOC125953463 n=1 Tax=Anopheles darlingi TaxID=43151 RepID=UPI0021002A78|nr:uncharacterized protein LOC125953463 [Anopheles darlingi]